MRSGGPWPHLELALFSRYFGATLASLMSLYSFWNVWELPWEHYHRNLGFDSGTSSRDQECEQNRCVDNQRATGMISIHPLWHLVGETEHLWYCPKCKKCLFLIIIITSGRYKTVRWHIPTGQEYFLLFSLVHNSLQE